MFLLYLSLTYSIYLLTDINILDLFDVCCICCRKNWIVQGISQRQQYKIMDTVFGCESNSNFCQAQVIEDGAR